MTSALDLLRAQWEVAQWEALRAPSLLARWRALWCWLEYTRRLVEAAHG